MKNDVYKIKQTLLLLLGLGAVTEEGKRRVSSFAAALLAGIASVGANAVDMSATAEMYKANMIFSGEASDYGSLLTVGLSMPYRTIVERNRQSAEYSETIALWEAETLNETNGQTYDNKKTALCEVYMFDLLARAYKASHTVPDESAELKVIADHASVLKKVSEAAQSGIADYMYINISSMDHDERTLLFGNLKLCPELTAVSPFIDSDGAILGGMSVTISQLIYGYCNVAEYLRLFTEHSDVFARLANSNCGNAYITSAARKIADHCAQIYNNEFILAAVKTAALQFGGYGTHPSESYLNTLGNSALQSVWSFIQNDLSLAALSATQYVSGNATAHDRIVGNKLWLDLTSLTCFMILRKRSEPFCRLILQTTTAHYRQEKRFPRLTLSPRFTP